MAAAVRVTTQVTRLERFLVKNGIRSATWAANAGITRPTFVHVRDGNDPHLATVRSLVRAASEILGRRVRVSEIFDVGEGTSVPSTPVERKTATDAQQKTLRRYETRLDGILRSERIMPNEFAGHVGIVRQSLLRFRSGSAEPCLSTLAGMVISLRSMTGKPYLASHLYDIGEGLADLPAA